jgi:PTS system ascorbate-specific IIA component
LQADASTWQEAVKLSVDLLVKADVVEPRYYQAILDGVAQHGPYFVIAPGLAMPHGPEEGEENGLCAGDAENAAGFQP